MQYPPFRHSGRSLMSSFDTQQSPTLPTEQDLSALLEVARGSTRMAAFTGAGISTESGIPDYRGPGGVWEKRTPPTIDTFMTDRETQRAYWERRRNTYPDLLARQPNDGHRALADLEKAGRLVAVITQNIDGLHQAAGQAAERVVELHGSAHRVKCIACGRMWAAIAIHERLESGESVPSCVECGGALRGATILFGEALPTPALQAAVAIARYCDLMVIIGTSLVVNPAAKLPMVARESGAKIAIINRAETPLDGIADVRVRADAGLTLRALADALLA